MAAQIPDLLAPVGQMVDQATVEQIELARRVALKWVDVFLLKEDVRL